MRIGPWSLVCIAFAACKGPEVTYAPDASVSDAGAGAGAGASNSGDAGATSCDVPDNSASAPVGSCSSAAKFVDCTFDSGAGCGCLSNGATSCDGCGAVDGANCVDKCASNQYAVACGGPPLSDGGVYEAVPANCEIVAQTPSGKAYACCSCDRAK